MQVLILITNFHHKIEFYGDFKIHNNSNFWQLEYDIICFSFALKILIN